MVSGRRLYTPTEPRTERGVPHFRAAEALADWELALALQQSAEEEHARGDVQDGGVTVLVADEISGTVNMCSIHPFSHLVKQCSLHSINFADG